MRLGGAVAAVAALALSMGATPAAADSAWWHLSSSSWPAVLPSNGEGTVDVLVENAGDAQATGSALTITDRLPAGVVPQSASLFLSRIGNGINFGFFCTVAGQEVTCTLSQEVMEILPVNPYGAIDLQIMVRVQSASSGAVNEISASGGDALPASFKRALSIGGAPAGYGVEGYELVPENADGTVDTQAGSHPFQLTSTLTLNQTSNTAHPPALAKDLHFDLPPGLIGNPTPFPRCTTGQFSTIILNGVDLCPNDTAVGAAAITIEQGAGFGDSEGGNVITYSVPLFNLTPATGEPARFGFVVAGVPVILDTGVRTGGDYGVTVTVKNISELVSFIGSRVTFWGVPGDPRHDSARGWSCIAGEVYIREPSGEPKPALTEGLLPPCSPLAAHKPPPLIALPTSCTGMLHTTLSTDSWSAPGVFTPPFVGEGEPTMDGCNRLPFSASIGVAPDGQAGSTPTGLTVGVHVPQEEALNPTGLAPADVKDTTVALPAGVALNPAGADGLLSCSLEEIALQSHSFPTCPEASKVGTVEIETPLLPNRLEGAAYLASQSQNPFGSLIALYLVARDPVSGVLVKLAGEVKPDPVTGQLVSTFLNTPQLPFEDLRLHFFGGSRAPLGTPALCGAYTTTASIAPWSGNAADESSSTFEVLSGPDGSPCHDPLPFAPELTAGSLNIQAGAFTPFTLTMSRQDGNQDLKAIQLKMPPGLLGTLTSVKLCDEAKANAGTCGPESLIGETTVSVGLGDTPFSVKGGKVYITEGYKGAPYGLSIVNPAKAGPFDLGQVVVRAKIELDPASAALIVTTDSTGPYAIPQIIDGIPLQIKHVNVTVTRPEGFTFNPTNCEPQKISGSLTSSQDASSTLAVPFQVTNCATLGFKPQFKVSTNGKTSRNAGASLDVRLSYPKARWGSQANIRYVKVDLPKQLPSFLATLQHACLDTVFDQNPASCPSASRVGTATASTPVLPVPLEGPAYFVSHGGLKFPELVIVLSGYGVSVQIHGETFISKTGVTSSTFKYIPDVPVGNFELKLPQGPNHALAANGNLCTNKLRMPTTFIAQNGLTIKQNTPITATGCPKHKTHNASRHDKHKHKKK
jgi:uncharacterized repeat protein (TIGR01451 family)